MEEATKMQLVEWLDDLCVRFIINLPQEELESVERICFQVEEAQWFYEDFVRPLDPTLPSLPLRTFCLRMFKHCPLLAHFDEEQHIRAYETFLEYKTRVPVRGAILLNEAMDYVLLVRGWKKGASWSFPRGKINKDEKDLDCAIREASEETGYDPRLAGLVHDEDRTKYIEVTMREQHMKLFVFRGVDMGFPFAPQTRKEISKIQWYRLSALPGWKKGKVHQTVPSQDGLSASKLYMVAPFLQPLKTWIAQQKKLDAGHSLSAVHAAQITHADDYLTDGVDLQQQSLPFAETVYQDPNLRDDPVYDQLDGNLPAPTIRPVSENAAAEELRRLLSIGQSQPQPPYQPPPTIVAPDSHGSQLLAMLRGSPSVNLSRNAPQMSPQEQQQMQPLSDFNQSQQIIPPLHLRQGSSMQPGMLSGFMGHQINHTSHGDRRPVQQPHFQFPHAAIPQQYSQGIVSPHHGMADSSLQSYVNMGPPAPYQRTGDPDLARDHRKATKHGPIIPPASDLPAPKLSNHHMNLLGAFKKPKVSQEAAKVAETPAPTKLPSDPMPQSTQITTQYPAEVQPDSTQSSWASVVQPPRTIAHQPMESQPAQVMSQTMPRLNGYGLNSFPAVDPSATLAARQSTPTAQQSTLLQLFRKSSLTPQQATTTATNVQPLPETQSSQNRPQVAPKAITIAQRQNDPTAKAPVKPLDLPAEPVEMSANPSPLPHMKQLFDPKDGKMKAHDPTYRTLARPQSSHGPDAITTATVSGPIKVPDLNIMKRRSRHQHSNSGSHQSKPAQAPLQILKRPVTPKEFSPAKMSTPHASTSTKSTISPQKVMEKRKPNVFASRPGSSSSLAKSEASKPFAPQILRRPKDETPARKTPPAGQQQVATPPTQVAELPAPVVSPPTQPAVVAANPANNKQDLLSLFKKAQPVTTVVPTPPEEKPLQESLTSKNQKQSLLSLFTKSTATLADIQNPAVEQKAIESAAVVPDTPVSESGPATVRSRLNSTNSNGTMSPVDPTPASATKDVRLGSQTPMSPNDKGFLLNFLSGFAKSSGSKKV